MEWRTALTRARQNPWMAVTVGAALLKGQYYRLKYRLQGRHVVLGRHFRVFGRLDIRGPGTIRFGDDCAVFSSRIAPTTPWTQSPEAVICFGNGVALNGTRMSCKQRIEVGDGAMLAEARITDSDFHAIEPHGRPRLTTSGVTKPVIIGPNVWVCMEAMVLKGARIGENSVVAAGAVVTGRVPPNVVVFGNPARVVWRLKEPANSSSSNHEAEGILAAMQGIEKSHEQ